MKIIINNKAEKCTQQMTLEMVKMASTKEDKFSDYTDGTNHFLVVKVNNKISTRYTIYNQS